MVQIVCAGVDVKENNQIYWIIGFINMFYSFKSQIEWKNSKMAKIVSKFDLLTPKC